MVHFVRLKSDPKWFSPPGRAHFKTGLFRPFDENSSGKKRAAFQVLWSERGSLKDDNYSSKWNLGQRLVPLFHFSSRVLVRRGTRRSFSAMIP